MRPSYPSNCADLKDPDEALCCAQRQFASFLSLLDRNNQVLKVIGDMEEKSLGEYLFDLNYIRTSLRKVREGVCTIIDQLIALGGTGYEPLRLRYESIDAAIARLLPDSRPIPVAPFVIPLQELDRTHALSVGSKNAQLGELGKLGVPVPQGFAITAYAYKRFLDASELTERIAATLGGLDIRRYEDLVLTSDQVQQMVLSASVPRDLADAMVQAYARLSSNAPGLRVAMRSSGIGEDSWFSFAGQYATYLNVTEADLVSAYRRVVASKFTPQATYYFLSHAITEGELAMSVGCVAMIDAACAGVIYSRDPLHPDADVLLVQSVCGLGEALVDGTLTPDAFRVCRSDPSQQQASVADKRTMLVMAPHGGTRTVAVPEDRRHRASLEPAQLESLARYALLLEQHYGAPQDIEFAVDRAGRLFLLQTRPLQLIRHLPQDRPPVAIAPAAAVLDGGTAACPGAGAGPVVQVASNRDLFGIAEGSVVVAPNPFPGLITVMGKARALVTEVGGVASHMATLAREYRIPALVGVKGATGLRAGRVVTVDATGGRILDGEHAALIDARRQEAAHGFADTPLFHGFRELLDLIAPLNVLHPADPGFTPDNCKTLHDITRFAHQRAMDEMFGRVTRLESTVALGLRLATALPLPVVVLFVDRPMSGLGRNGAISEHDVDSVPFRAFWGGMLAQGWPSGPSRDSTRFASALSTYTSERPADSYAIKSYAVLARTYMMLSLHLGYHFTTIEALAEEQPSKNYIRLQHKDGGATLERRVRRIRLLAALLERLGFDNASQSDFLDASISYTPREDTARKLEQLGHIVLMTKQLDMALSNDRITDWYIGDFLAPLRLDKDGSGA